MTDAPEERPAEDETGNSHDSAPVDPNELQRQQLQAERLKYEDAASQHDYVELLAEVGAAYISPHEFKPGDLVQWREHMRNRAYPHYGRPAIVVGEPKNRRLNVSVFGGTDETTQDDILVGFLDGDLDLVVSLVDSHRFQPWSE